MTAAAVALRTDTANFAPNTALSLRSGMGKITFLRISALALTETLAEIRVDKPVRVIMSLIVPIFSIVVVFRETRSISWSGIVGLVALLIIAVVLFAIKLITVPIRLINEAHSEHQSYATAASDRIAQLDSQLAQLRTPAPEPQRNPDGVYQHGYDVGSVVGARQLPNTSVYVFDQINDQGKFDGNAEFEYREYVLKTRVFAGQGSNRGGGAFHHAYYVLEAEIIRRR